MGDSTASAACFDRQHDADDDRRLPHDSSDTKKMLSSVVDAQPFVEYPGGFGDHVSA